MLYFMDYPLEIVGLFHIRRAAVIPFYQCCASLMLAEADWHKGGTIVKCGQEWAGGGQFWEGYG